MCVGNIIVIHSPYEEGGQIEPFTGDNTNARLGKK